MRLVIFFILIFFLAPFSPKPAFATHEVNHRYVVTGYVRDASGNPLPGLNIVLEHKGGEKKSATTDRGGYYEVLFHLHDENAGDEILVTAGSETKKLVVAFDPKDHVTYRTGRVDFGAPGKGDNAWIYWTGGAGLFIGAMFYLNRVRKQRKRARKKELRHKKK